MTKPYDEQSFLKLLLLYFNKSPLDCCSIAYIILPPEGSNSLSEMNVVFCDRLLVELQHSGGKWRRGQTNGSQTESSPPEEDEASREASNTTV